jgi:serine/threonine protein kinase
MDASAMMATRCPRCFGELTSSQSCSRCGGSGASRPSPFALPAGTLLAGQYRIGQVLGQPGGFGITYLAWDERLETRVAIKEFFPRDLAGRGTDRATLLSHTERDGALFDYGLKQFLQEARTLARFDHPNIVRVRNFFEANGTGYLVMDYYEGQSLAAYLAQQPAGRLGERVAIDILLRVLDGLRAVHAAGILHRDIDPHNIYLTAEGRIILLDFGAARVAVGEKSRSLSVILKPGYAPYEQYASSGKQGAWTDVYACAATLYRMVTGQVPPDAPGRVLEDTLVPPARIRREVSAHVSDSIVAGLAVRPEHRPQTVREFQDRLMGTGAEPQNEPVAGPTLPISGRKDGAGGRGSGSDGDPAPVVQTGWTRLDSWLALGLISWAVAWFVQVGPTLAGWDAYLFATSAIFEGSAEGLGWAVAALWFFSAQTNLVLVLAAGILIYQRFKPTRGDLVLRWTTRALWVSLTVNLNWLVFIRTELRPGYLLWVTGFAVTAHVASRHAAAAARLAAADADPRSHRSARRSAVAAAANIAVVLAMVGYGTTSHYLDNLGDEPIWSSDPGSSAQAVVFSPDGRLAFTGHTDGTIRIWNLASGTEVRRLDGHDLVSALALHPARDLLLSGGYDRSLRWWDLDSGSEVGSGEAPGIVNSVAISPNGELALAGGQDTEMLWDIARAVRLRTFEGSRTRWVEAVAFSPDSRLALAAGSDSLLNVWDVATREVVWTFRHDSAVRSAAFSPDGRSVLSGGHNATVRLWSLETGREVWRFTTDGAATVVFSPDGRYVLSAGHRRLSLRDAATGREVRSLRTPGNDYLWEVAISPDGRHAITGGTTVKLWEIDPGSDTPMSAPDPATLARAEALERALAVRREILDGADFGEVAERESADPGSARRGGDLGTIQRGQMVPAIEQAVWSQPIGEVGAPVLTQFGYHIIKVESRTEDQASARHILIPVEMSPASED